MPDPSNVHFRLKQNTISLGKGVNLTNDCKKTLLNYNGKSHGRTLR